MASHNSSRFILLLINQVRTELVTVNIVTKKPRTVQYSTVQYSTVPRAQTGYRKYQILVAMISKKFENLRPGLAIYFYELQDMISNVLVSAASLLSPSFICL